MMDRFWDWEFATSVGAVVGSLGLAEGFRTGENADRLSSNCGFNLPVLSLWNTYCGFFGTEEEVCP